MASPVMHKIVENYILYDSIGAGQYGKVYRAKNTKTNETVAVKVIPVQKFALVPKLEEFTANEIKMLARITNPNVVRFIEMLKTVNNTYLVYEFCQGGTLEDIIRKRRFIAEKEALAIFLQLLNAFKAIYRENILHRDLKPSNILNNNGIFKIADFGFCKKVSGPQELTCTMVGSPIYMAPEILKGYPYNIKSDIWSLGVVLYEMLFGICPFEDKTLAGLIYQIDRKPLVFPRAIHNISQTTEQLLRRMLVLDHRNRISWEDLLQYKVILEVEEKPPVLRSLDINASRHVTSLHNLPNLTTRTNSTREDASKKPAVSPTLAPTSAITTRTHEDKTIKTDRNKDKENAVTKNGKKTPEAEYGSTGSTGTTGSAGSDGATEAKLNDLDNGHKYNEAIHQRIEGERLILRTLIKERNKIVFLTKIVKTALEYNIGERVAAIVYLMLKKAYILAEGLRKEISIENSKSKLRKFREWEEFQSTDDFLAFSAYLSEEIEEIIVLTAIVKREIEALTGGDAEYDDPENGSLLKNPIFERELLSNGNMNDKFFEKALLIYTEDVQDAAIEKRGTREESTSLWNHAIRVLDCSRIDELFEKTFQDGTLNHEEQQYFTDMNALDKDKLQTIVTEKMNVLRLIAV